MAELPPYPGVPRWVWWARLAAILAVILFVGLHLAGLSPTHHG